MTAKEHFKEAERLLSLAQESTVKDRTLLNLALSAEHRKLGLAIAGWVAEQEL